jgi:protein-S-isoprenylcysteine O-methyltransferase Ste14
MSRKTSEYLPAILNGVTGIGVLLMRFFVDLRFPIPKEIAKPSGLFIVALGMFLVIWASLYIREAMWGEVEPRLNVLVQEGPYRFVRHPVYLGMTIALAGATVTLRSWLGIIGVFFLFLPTEIYRARLEEGALSRKFGDEWKRYATRTGFILPFVGKRKVEC